jgi:hypothetical protein
MYQRSFIISKGLWVLNSKHYLFTYCWTDNLLIISLKTNYKRKRGCFIANMQTIAALYKILFRLGTWAVCYIYLIQLYVPLAFRD